MNEGFKWFRRLLVLAGLVVAVYGSVMFAKTFPSDEEVAEEVRNQVVECDGEVMGPGDVCAGFGPEVGSYESRLQDADDFRQGLEVMRWVGIVLIATGACAFGGGLLGEYLDRTG